MVRYKSSLVLFGGFYDTGYEVSRAPAAAHLRRVV
jgi:hypothetical protein